MPIIINDFEITTNAPSARSEERQEQAAESKQKQHIPIRPEDIERIQQRLQMRRARIWAE
ncbi:MAG: hypothetical protein IPN42_02480 [Methylococcaceae bacterium]|nr:hypothetical protein [Methylococcaceae bacterium]